MTMQPITSTWRMRSLDEDQQDDEYTFLMTLLADEPEPEPCPRRADQRRPSRPSAAKNQHLERDLRTLKRHSPSSPKINRMK